MSKYSEGVVWFESLPEGEVKEIVRPFVEVVDAMFLHRAALQAGSDDIKAKCQANLKQKIQNLLGGDCE